MPPRRPRRSEPTRDGPELQAPPPAILLRPTDVAVMAGVSTTTVWNWQKAGLLPVAKRTPAGHARFWYADVLALLKGPNEAPVTTE